MRITHITAVVLATLVTVSGTTWGQEDSVSVEQPTQSKRRSVLTLAATAAEPATTKSSAVEPSATVLRATTETGVSKAEIFRQSDTSGQEGIRVAALPEGMRVANRVAQSRARSIHAGGSEHGSQAVLGWLPSSAKSQEDPAVTQGVIINGAPTPVEGSVTSPRSF